MDIVKDFREGELKHALEKQLHQLQQQVDDLRKALRDQQARSSRLEESLRQTETRVADVGQEAVQSRQELNQVVQVIQMDLQRLRNQFAALQGRVEDPMAAVKELRAQLLEFIGTRRREEGALDELRSGVSEVSRLLQTALSEVSGLKGEYRSLSASLTARDAASEDLRAAISNLSSAVQLEEQRVRRQVEEVTQRFEGVYAEIASLGSALRLEVENRRNFQDGLADLRDKFERLAGELRAVADREQNDASRLSALVDGSTERLEEVRRHLQGFMDDLRDSIHRLEASLDARIGHLEERIGQVESKLPLIFGELSDHGGALEDLRAEIARSEERWLKRQLQVLQDHLAVLISSQSEEA